MVVRLLMYAERTLTAGLGESAVVAAEFSDDGRTARVPKETPKYACRPLLT